MTDLADAAQAVEEREREASLVRARTHAPPEAARYRGRQRICTDCAAPIPAARLARVPHAVRCTECQGAHETRGARR